MNQTPASPEPPRNRLALMAQTLAGAFARLSGKAWDKVDAEAWKKMQAAGYTVVVAGEDDLKRIHAEGDALRDAWVERMKKLGVDGNAALTMFKDEIAKVAAEK